MSLEIEESDWKVFRQLRPIALDRFCWRVLDEIQQVSADTKRSTHERYLAVYDLIQRRDRELADAFNDPRRSHGRLATPLHPVSSVADRRGAGTLQPRVA